MSTNHFPFLPLSTADQAFRAAPTFPPIPYLQHQLPFLSTPHKALQDREKKGQERQNIGKRQETKEKKVLRLGATHPANV